MAGSVTDYGWLFLNRKLKTLLFILAFLSADFEQVKTSQLFAEPEYTQGHLTYRQPDYLRWEYTSPQTVIWELDGTKGNVSAQVRQIMSLILKSVSGEYLQPNDDFHVTTNDNLTELTPKRRELKQLFSKITIRMDSKSEIAEEVILYEKNGDQTNIHFKNVKRDFD